MAKNNQRYETSDMALGAYLYCCGTQVIAIDRHNPRRCIFVFQAPDPLLISEWQAGRANVNALAYYNALQSLKGKIFRGRDD